MRRTALVVGLLFLAPGAAGAQSLGVRVGTLGIGAEAAMPVLPRVAIRGGMGFIPYEYESEKSDVRYSIEAPSRVGNLGVALSLAGGLHIGGGIFFKKDITLDAEPAGTYEIGGRTYSGSELVELEGTVDHPDSAPYVALSFGQGFGRGMGVFLDLGVAFVGEPKLELKATGPATSSQQFNEDLERERQQLENDFKDYLKYYPILSLGFRIGLR